jgi:hypothetical protein
VIYVDEDGREIDASRVREMMGKEGEMEFEEAYYEDDEIMNGDDYIDDEEEERAKVIKG